MKPLELAECLRRLNMSSMALGKLLGRSLDGAVDLETARCIRALVLKPKVLALVNEVRICCPDAVFLAIRDIPDE